MAEAGAEVVAAALDTPGGERVAAEIRDGGGRARFRHLDVRDPSSVRALVEETAARCGRIDAHFTVFPASDRARCMTGRDPASTPATPRSRAP